MLPPPPRSTLFPYTTLFRSLEGVTEGVNDRLALSLAHEPVVHVHARELLADRPMDQDRGHGRVDAAGERAEDALAVHLRPDRFHRGVDEPRHRPRAAYFADRQEVLEDLLSLRRVDDFRVELDRVEPPVLVGHGRDRAIRGLRERREALRRTEHGVAVAHPDRDSPGRFGLDTVEQTARALERDLGLAVLSALGGNHVATHEVAHRLHAVADPEDRDARGEER